MRADRGRGRGAVLDLDQPGIGEDQAVQPGLVAVERKRAGAANDQS